MRDKRVAVECEAVKLESGYELPYFELGKENEKTVVVGGFYFYTFMDFVNELAKKYHVYAIVMRQEGSGELFDADGDINWAKQWGKDIYEVTQELGVEKFHYVGKCHGAIPGYWLIKEHPECVESFVSIGSTPHVVPQDQNRWLEGAANEGPAFMLKALKSHHRLPEKVAEMQAIGVSVGNNAGVNNAVAASKLAYYGAHTEGVFDNDYEAVKQFIREIKTPIMYLFGTDDILYYDYKNANDYAVFNTPNAKTVYLQGERHLMEMDCADKLAYEIRCFIESLK
ncbi:MAG: alpha/beta hydrolase [Erysipelotrichaceae bacterium]|nr:alpha/beta hydrolase [Erysipelotrichaceae bacterium]